MNGSLRAKMADFLWKITAAHAKNLSFMEKVLNLLGYLDGQTTVNRKEIDKVQTQVRLLDVWQGCEYVYGLISRKIWVYASHLTTYMDELLKIKFVKSHEDVAGLWEFMTRKFLRVHLSALLSLLVTINMVHSPVIRETRPQQ